MFSPPGFSSSPPSSTLEFQLPSEQFQLTDQVCHCVLYQVCHVYCACIISGVLCCVLGVSSVLCIISGVSHVLRIESGVTCTV